MTNDVALDFTLLKTFLVVAETRNLSAAATALGLSQPTVTQHLQRLEAGLGLALFRRNTRPFGLTSAAEHLLAGLSAPLGKIEALLAETRTRRDSPRTVLRIAMPDSLSCVLGAEILAASGHLAQQLELRAGISPWIEDTLLSGLCDLAIDCPPFAKGGKGDSRLLFHDPYVIVVPRQTAELPLTLVVQDMPQVSFGRSSKFGTETAAIAHELGAREPARFSFDSTHSLLRFVQAGYGWAVTSALCLLQAPSALRDLTLHECPADRKRTFHLLNGRMNETSETTGFADVVVSVFRMCLNERWKDLSPEVATLLARANEAEMFAWALSAPAPGA